MSPISLLRQQVDGEGVKSCELLYFRPALGFPGMGRGGLGVMRRAGVADLQMGEGDEGSGWAGSWHWMGRILALAGL